MFSHPLRKAAFNVKPGHVRVGQCATRVVAESSAVRDSDRPNKISFLTVTGTDVSRAIIKRCHHTSA